MAWSIKANDLRALKGNEDACFDTELNYYIDSLITDIEYLTGFDFDFPAGSQTVLFKNTKRKNEFVLDGTILQLGAWQTVTLVEKGYISSPTYSTLVENSDYTLEVHSTQGYTPITELYFICSPVRELETIRITGTQGFSADIPPDLLYVMSEMVDAYFQNLSNGTGAYTVQSERSLTRSVTYKDSDLTSLKLFTPTRIPEFLTIINKYNVKKHYPF
jgi:hypothetical protein